MSSAAFDGGWRGSRKKDKKQTSTFLPYQSCLRPPSPPQKLPSHSSSFTSACSRVLNSSSPRFACSLAFKDRARLSSLTILVTITPSHLPQSHLWQLLFPPHSPSSSAPSSPPPSSPLPFSPSPPSTTPSSSQRQPLPRRSRLRPGRSRRLSRCRGMPRP